MMIRTSTVRLLRVGSVPSKLFPSPETSQDWCSASNRCLHAQGIGLSATDAWKQRVRNKLKRPANICPCIYRTSATHGSRSDCAKYVLAGCWTAANCACATGFMTAKGKAFLVVLSGTRSLDRVRGSLSDIARRGNAPLLRNLKYIRDVSGPLDWLPRICGTGATEGYSFVVERTVVRGRAPAALASNSHHLPAPARGKLGPDTDNPPSGPHFAGWNDP